MGVLQPAGVLDLSLRFPRWLARKVTTPRNPVRLTGGQARLLPADWAPGGHRRPEELPWPSRERLAKVPSYDPEAAWTSPRDGRDARSHRPRRAVRARQPFQR